MTVTLTPRLEAFIRQQVESGRYADANEVVEEALRLLEDRDRLDRLRAEVAKGFEQLDRGEGVLYTPELMERLKREADENARTGKPIRDAVKPPPAPLT